MQTHGDMEYFFLYDELKHNVACDDVIYDFFLQQMIKI